MTIRQFAKSIDNYFGRYFSFETADFIKLSTFHLKKKNKHLRMNKAEWHNYFNKTQELSNSKNWHQKLANEEARKFFIFYELYLILKNKYYNILEIGSGLGYIGYFLNLTGINVFLSDVIKVKLPFSSIKKKLKQIDFLKIKLKDIKGYDLILAAHVDYLFNSSQIKKFLKKCSSQNTDVIFCGTAIIGPVRFLRSKFLQKKQLKDIRRNGFKRSLLVYSKMGKLFNYKVSIKSFESRILKDQNWHLIHFKKI